MIDQPRELQRRLEEELVRRASGGCEGPLDDGCWSTKLPMHLWCDPCRCQEAVKALRDAASRLAAQEEAVEEWKEQALIYRTALLEAQGGKFRVEWEKQIAEKDEAIATLRAENTALRDNNQAVKAMFAEARGDRD